MGVLDTGQGQNLNRASDMLARPSSSSYVARRRRMLASESGRGTWLRRPRQRRRAAGRRTDPLAIANQKARQPGPDAENSGSVLGAGDGYGGAIFASADRKRAIQHTERRSSRQCAGWWAATIVLADRPSCLTLSRLDQLGLRAAAASFAKLKGSRSVTSASGARCGNSVSTCTRYA